ncbi:MAG: aminomethyltransferase beta-barrel domain-containing protein, partial [Chitinophagales bacterium]
YKDPGTPCRLFSDESGKIRVEFDRPVKAIAPGQSAVFYEGNDVIGGGIIFSSFDL